MSDSNDDLYEKAKSAITDLYNDRSVSMEKTVENMNGLQEEIGTFIDCLEQDIENEKTDPEWNINADIAFLSKSAAAAMRAGVPSKSSTGK